MPKSHRSKSAQAHGDQSSVTETDEEASQEFHLTKWYLDAADDRGNVYIGYQIRLHWRGLKLHGYHHFWRTPDQDVHTQGGFSQQLPPTWEEKDHLVWQPEHVHAVWISAANPIEEMLLSTDQGEIQWHCTQPMAEARIQLPRLAFTGWGYTECIDMTLPVWKLPFTTLYWGRCHSATHYLVWIAWKGATEHHVIWHNGERSTDLTIADDRIIGPDFQLKMKEHVPLRQGTLISTIFKPFRQVTRLLPQATFLADERKWYGLGQVETLAGSEPAIVLYEEVFWP